MRAENGSRIDFRVLFPLISDWCRGLQFVNLNLCNGVSIGVMLRFDEAKAMQAAAYFLKLRGGQMHYINLIKLLYLTDREALIRWGAPVTTDRHASMDNGPVTSRILNLITEERPKPVWEKSISAPLGEYEVRLLPDAPTDRLSPAEERPNV